MENRTDFDLNQHVRNWRESLGNRPGICGEDVEELESHLRETFEGLCKTGLTYEEAFLIAARRIGSPGELEEQYATVNVAAVWKTLAGWMIAGVLGYWVLLGVSGTLSRLALLIGAGLEINGMKIGFLGVAIHVALLIAVARMFARQRGRPSVAITGKSQRRISASSLQLIIWLAALSLVVSAANILLDAVVTRFHPPASLGGFYLITSYYVGPLSYLFFVAFGIWVASGRAVKSRMAGTLGSLLLLLSLTACSPDSAPGSSATPTVSTNASWETASAGEQTPFERCLALMPSDTNGAVESFLKLNLTNGELFTPGTPLSFSETEYVKLPRPVIDKMGGQVIRDIEKVRLLIRTVRAHRDRAIADNDAAIAETCRKQLAALGARLASPDNLSLSQIVGKNLDKDFAE